MKYIALLRGINISGKNKIAMADLKTELENMEFFDISTYLNSGNVVLSSDTKNEVVLKSEVEKMIKNKFGLDVPVYVIKYDEMKNILANAPLWWGTSDKDQYDNLIFIMSDDKADDIANMVGPVSEGLERIQISTNVIFWTFDRKSYQKCNWWKKTATAGIAKKLTIRTANTLAKICK